VTPARARATCVTGGLLVRLRGTSALLGASQCRIVSPPKERTHDPTHPFFFHRPHRGRSPRSLRARFAAAAAAGPAALRRAAVPAAVPAAAAATTAALRAAGPGSDARPRGDHCFAVPVPDARRFPDRHALGLPGAPGLPRGSSGAVTSKAATSNAATSNAATSNAERGTPSAQAEATAPEESPRPPPLRSTRAFS
jgi:hypothetical protein